MSSSGRKAFPSERSFSWVFLSPGQRTWTGSWSILSGCFPEGPGHPHTHIPTNPTALPLGHCWTYEKEAENKPETRKSHTKPPCRSERWEMLSLWFKFHFFDSFPASPPRPSLPLHPPPPRPPIESPLPGRPAWPPPLWPVRSLSSPLAEQTCYVFFFFLSSLSFDSTKLFFS